MKLYNHAVAPNPRRVRIFAAEKGIEFSLEEVDILAGQSRTPEFLAKNSSGGVPVLELDDGSYLSESVAICRYLEGLHPEPNLLGRDLREQAEIERWNRRMELERFAAIGCTVQNTAPIFQGRFKQFPDYGEAQRTLVYQRLERMDRELNGHHFVAGGRFTIADITALVAIDIGGRSIEPSKRQGVRLLGSGRSDGMPGAWPHRSAHVASSG
jgi:glutathione S-transferase